MSTNTPKRGGKRPGAGCPPKDPADKVVKCHISMTKAHHTATKGDRAGIIRRALDAYFKEQERAKRMRDVYNGIKEERYEFVADGSKSVLDFPGTKSTVTITTSDKESEPIIFTVKGYED